MPKNDKKNIPDSASAKAAKATTPAVAYTPPVASADAVAPTPISSRRLGTGALIGISAAGVALLAGVLGGGIAIGATAANHGPAGVSHEMSEADGRMAGGPGNEAGMQGGARPGSEMNGVSPEAPSDGTSTSAPTPAN